MTQTDLATKPLRAVPGVSTGKMGRRARKTIFPIAVFLFSLLWFAPILWMLSTSFKPNADAATYPVKWFPENPTLENYETILFNPDRGVNIVKSFGVSTLVSTAMVAGVLGTSTPAAYAFARLKFRGRNVLFWLLVLTLALPVQMFLIPVYLILDEVDLLNKLWAVILPGIGPAFALFVLRQFMLAVPVELEEASRLDGCNMFQTFLYIVVPQVRPALVSVGLITFLNSWNDFLWPLIVIRNRDIYPLTLSLFEVRIAYHAIFGAGTIMASYVIATVPVIVLFLLAKNQLLRGISLTGTGVK
ncbi:MAG: carbohydrate ABC transporter permease [Chloroflexi bacterium]|nr:carbohydrate ABC transporter permease [Chloroflexota bacterium]